MLAKVNQAVVTIVFLKTIADIIFAVAPQMLFVTIWVALSGSCSIDPPSREAASLTSSLPFLSSRVKQSWTCSSIKRTVAKSLPNVAS